MELADYSIIKEYKLPFEMLLNLSFKIDRKNKFKKLFIEII